MKTHIFSRRLAIFLAFPAWFCSSGTADDFETLAIVRDNNIAESSGLAASRNHPKCVWIHNDSGDEARLYLVGYDGETKGVVRVSGAEAMDWEDMCSFEHNGKNWLLIADVGDNAERRKGKKQGCRLYLLREPQVPRANGIPTITWPVASIIQFEYDDGPRNCESVAVDVKRKEVLLLSKSAPHKSRLYQLPLNVDKPQQNLNARHIASPFVLYATAIDVSPDGSTLVICTMLNGMIVKRTTDQSWKKTFQRPSSIKSIMLPPRRQGETICFDSEGRHLLLNSEFPLQPLYRMPVVKEAVRKQ